MEIAEPRSIIYNEALKLSKLPYEWKLGHITAIFKKGNKSEPGNYRPISLTSILCKILESIIRDHIMTYMLANNLFSLQQFGFLPGISTVLQLLKVLDKWTEILDGGGCVDVIYCDFKKAFDTVPHRRLMSVP